MVVVSRLSFKTLYSALAAAGLADTLRGAGPFTLFAPTNEAFAEIPPEQLQALLANPAELGKILTYHVVAGTRYVQPSAQEYSNTQLLFFITTTPQPLNF